ncbi:hypothetical protein QRX50_13365 [Amycolatopsis carbonis]|uniref:Uncharacterized protein n=1 Tax=Amycolatopsis carbonis TaxID=715471 RepID=A0A9Y2INP0_9PSEU|nr:hypothetical protein [Amycolatopsis sp. 2-15]WIX81673.1 hypothetical protein QRX50_13365 [Amycolatopsis sp. 2-15]
MDGDPTRAVTVTPEPEGVRRVNGHAVVKDPPLVVRIDRVLAVIVAVHCAGVVARAVVHPSVASVGVAAGIVALSVVGVWRHFRTRGRLGAVLLGVTMAGSFVCGAWLPAGVVTNGVLSVVEVLGAVFAVAVLRRRVRIT